MDNQHKLEKYLRFNNVKLVERRVAGTGNHFEVHHQFPGERHIRVLGEFMLADEDVVRMGGFDIELVADYLLKHTRDILNEVTDKSDQMKYQWSLRPTRLI